MSFFPPTIEYSLCDPSPISLFVGLLVCKLVCIIITTIIIILTLVLLQLLLLTIITLIIVIMLTRIINTIFSIIVIIAIISIIVIIIITIVIVIIFPVCIVIGILVLDIAAVMMMMMSGSYIYAGEPSTFHDWEFRTSMRLKLYEDSIRAKTRRPKGDTKSIDPEDSDGDSRAEEASPTRAATAPVPSEDRPDMEATPAPADGSSSPARRRVATPKSDDSGSVKSVASALPMDESTPYTVKARTEMVHRVLEGLRDEAFELARDIGIESLTEPGGLRTFITQMRNVVFPRAAEEARELFRAGQRHGVLARQGGESMLSHVSRRRRWWKLLKSL
eukprot:s133_g30.t1